MPLFVTFQLLVESSGERALATKALLQAFNALRADNEQLVPRLDNLTLLLLQTRYLDTLLLV
jgi:hypothetical protein